MRKWPSEKLQKDLIHCLQQQWQGHQGGQTNTQWKHKTTYLVWHFIATLSCIHLCFWHCKQHLPLWYHGDSGDTNIPLTIPWGQWRHKHTRIMIPSNDTMGTVVTQTYLLRYHGDSGDTNIQELWYHGNSVETVAVTQNISNDKDMWQKVSNNVIKSIEWETKQHMDVHSSLEIRDYTPTFVLIFMITSMAIALTFTGEMTFAHLICIQKTRNMVYDMALDGMSWTWSDGKSQTWDSIWWKESNSRYIETEAVASIWLYNGMRVQPAQTYIWKNERVMAHWPLYGDKQNLGMFMILWLGLRTWFTKHWQHEGLQHEVKWNRSLQVYQKHPKGLGSMWDQIKIDHLYCLGAHESCRTHLNKSKRKKKERYRKYCVL